MLLVRCVLSSRDAKPVPRLALHCAATKFIGGHSDVTAGVLAVKDKALADRIYFVQVGWAVGLMRGMLCCTAVGRRRQTNPTVLGCAFASECMHSNGRLWCPWCAVVARARICIVLGNVLGERGAHAAGAGLPSRALLHLPLPPPPDPHAAPQNAEGTALGPFDSWLLVRGIKTMALRMERQVRLLLLKRVLNKTSSNGIQGNEWLVDA